MIVFLVVIIDSTHCILYLTTLMNMHYKILRNYKWIERRHYQSPKLWQIMQHLLWVPMWVHLCKTLLPMWIEPTYFNCTTSAPWFPRDSMFCKCILTHEFNKCPFQGFRKRLRVHLFINKARKNVVKIYFQNFKCKKNTML